MKQNQGFAGVGIIIAIVLAFVVVGGGGYYLVSNSKVEQNTQGANSNQISKNISVSQSDETWVKSPKLKVLYPASWHVESEGYYLTPAQQEARDLETGGIPFIQIRNSTNTLSIEWGGAQSGCTSRDFDRFQPGVSIDVCLKGMHASLQGTAPERNFSSDEKKIFTDFIRENTRIID